MPKERIYTENVSGDECDISLQWEPAQGWHERDGDGGAGYVTLALVKQTDDHEQVVGYSKLSRVALNRLFEKGRRARDAAYDKEKI